MNRGIFSITQQNRRTNPMLRFRIIIPAIITLFTAAGCTTATTQERDRLISQNKIYEKRSLLLERENSVLKHESSQVIQNLHSAEAHLEKAEADIIILRKKYDADTAILRSRADVMATQNALLQKESSEKISQLTEQNREREKKFSEDIQRLNNEIKTLSETFASEREALKTEFARREFEYSGKINRLDSEILEKDRKITSLEESSAALALKIAAIMEKNQAKGIQGIRDKKPGDEPKNVIAPDEGKPNSK
jgi:hypothetical protein